MRIAIHDYVGHAFPTELSRELARKGHDVQHLYFAEDPGPKGPLERRSGDPRSLRFVPISIGRLYEKGNLFARRANDIRYGRLVARHIRQEKPDVVLSGNTPTEAQQHIVRACSSVGTSFVYWVQDFYSVAVTKLLTRKLGVAGAMIGRYYSAMERSQMRRAAGVVVITEDFLPMAAAWAGDIAKVAVIENWGVLQDIPVLPKKNGWSIDHGCSEQFTFLYSGTLGLKHNPELLAALAERMQGRAKVLVVGQGLSIPKLEALKAEKRLDNMDIIGLQRFADFPMVLASADVAVAVIETDAGTYSVPSKVQSYFCSARPVLLAAPAENLVARVVSRTGAGIVVHPDDVGAFLYGAESLYGSPRLRAKLAGNGRRHAEQSYSPSSIAAQFEQVFERGLGRGGGGLERGRGASSG